METVKSSHLSYDELRKTVKERYKQKYPSSRPRFDPHVEQQKEKEKFRAKAEKIQRQTREAGYPVSLLGSINQSYGQSQLENEVNPNLLLHQLASSKYHQTLSYNSGVQVKKTNGKKYKQYVEQMYYMQTEQSRINTRKRPVKQLFSPGNMPSPLGDIGGGCFSEYDISSPLGQRGPTSPLLARDLVALFDNNIIKNKKESLDRMFTPKESRSRRFISSPQHTYDPSFGDQDNSNSFMDRTYTSHLQGQLQSKRGLKRKKAKITCSRQDPHHSSQSRRAIVTRSPLDDKEDNYQQKMRITNPDLDAEINGIDTNRSNTVRNQYEEVTHPLRDIPIIQTETPLRDIQGTYTAVLDSNFVETDGYSAFKCGNLTKDPSPSQPRQHEIEMNSERNIVSQPKRAGLDLIWALPEPGATLHQSPKDPSSATLTTNQRTETKFPGSNYNITAVGTTPMGDGTGSHEGPIYEKNIDLPGTGSSVTDQPHAKDVEQYYIDQHSYILQNGDHNVELRNNLAGTDITKKTQTEHDLSKRYDSQPDSKGRGQRRYDHAESALDNPRNEIKISKSKANQIIQFDSKKDQINSLNMTQNSRVGTIQSVLDASPKYGNSDNNQQFTYPSPVGVWQNNKDIADKLILGSGELGSNATGSPLGDCASGTSSCEKVKSPDFKKFGSIEERQQIQRQSTRVGSQNNRQSNHSLYAGQHVMRVLNAPVHGVGFQNNANAVRTLSNSSEKRRVDKEEQQQSIMPTMMIKSRNKHKRDSQSAMCQFASKGRPKTQGQQRVPITFIGIQGRRNKLIASRGPEKIEVFDQRNARLTTAITHLGPVQSTTKSTKGGPSQLHTKATSKNFQALPLSQVKLKSRDFLNNQDHYEEVFERVKSRHERKRKKLPVSFLQQQKHLVNQFPVKSEMKTGQINQLSQPSTPPNEIHNMQQASLSSNPFMDIPTTISQPPDLVTSSPVTLVRGIKSTGANSREDSQSRSNQKINIVNNNQKSTTFVQVIERDQQSFDKSQNEKKRSESKVEGQKVLPVNSSVQRSPGEAISGWKSGKADPDQIAFQVASDNLGTINEDPLRIATKSQKKLKCRKPSLVRTPKAGRSLSPTQRLCEQVRQHKSLRNKNNTIIATESIGQPQNSKTKDVLCSESLIPVTPVQMDQIDAYNSSNHAKQILEQKELRLLRLSKEYLVKKRMKDAQFSGTLKWAAGNTNGRGPDYSELFPGPDGIRRPQKILAASNQRSLDLKNLNMKKKLLEGMLQHKQKYPESMINTNMTFQSEVGTASIPVRNVNRYDATVDFNLDPQIIAWRREEEQALGGTLNILNVQEGQPTYTAGVHEVYQETRTSQGTIPGPADLNLSKDEPSALDPNVEQTVDNAEVSSKRRERSRPSQIKVDSGIDIIDSPRQPMTSAYHGEMTKTEKAAGLAGMVKGANSPEVKKRGSINLNKTQSCINDKYYQTTNHTIKADTDGKSDVKSGISLSILRGPNTSTLPPQQKKLS